MIVRILGIALMFTGIVLFVSVWPLPDTASGIKAFYAIVGGLATIGGAFATITFGDN